MKDEHKNLLSANQVIVRADVLFFIGLLALLFGRDYKISKIQPEIRAHQADTDWIGEEWLGLGMVFMLAAVVCFILAGTRSRWVRL